MIPLSFIICTLKADTLIPLLNSLSPAIKYKNNFEVIIVNQSNDDVPELLERYPFNFKILVPSVILSAPRARNFGASYAESEYLFFLDDDAFFIGDGGFYKMFSTVKQLAYEVLVVQRGEIGESSEYKSHWPNSKNINIRNFPRFVIEWNLIIKISLFNQIGGFHDIGPGSNHMAQSGEAFILISQILSKKITMKKLEDTRVAHPSLTTINGDKKRKYIYGHGYALGYSMKFMGFSDKLYWLSRFAASLLRDAAYVNYKLIGFTDGLKNNVPRTSLTLK